jgi:IclR family acetate operon transcriptional repressor
MQNKPAYAIESVDHALRLVVLLQEEGPLRVTDAAQRLGIARSTAHRLLAMLVYRDFAEQDADRRYQAGPVLRRPAATGPSAARLRDAALPHLQALMERTSETTNLMVLVGDQVRFVATVESHRVLRVGDREGRRLPARLASGGRALLAARTDAEISELYSAPGAPAVELPRLLRDLRRVRQQGFAVNDQATETGVTAIGVALRAPNETLAAACSIAMPTARYRRDYRDRLPEWVRSLTETVAAIERDLATPRA